MTDIKENITKKHTFKDYYDNAEWREKHLTYMKEKVRCECGKTVCRSNMSTHKKSHIHEQKMNALNVDPDYKDTLKKIEDAYQKALDEIQSTQRVASKSSTNKGKKNSIIK